CTRFRFAPLDSSNIRERMEHVIKAEGFVFKIKMPSDIRVKLINDLADIE
ncbi:hypothetical protein BHE74_00031632, partial [Ensete ventricosum]